MRPFLAAASCLLLSACAPLRPPMPGSAPGPAAAPRFLILYLVDGDANYTYHDTFGRRHLADTEAVAQAREVAAAAPEAEVYVFHRKRARFLGMGHDGRMWHYRRGRLLEEKAYDRPQGLGFPAEAALFRGGAAAALPSACQASGRSPPQAYFVYFGHEITAERASRELAGFTPGCDGASPFAAVILSACHGGTPAMTRALEPFTPLLVAAPGELHLSFLDTRAFARRDLADARSVAEAIARESFDRLQRNTLTEISLALYDTRKSAAYLEARRSAWSPAAADRGIVEAGSREGRDRAAVYRDCAELKGFGSGGDSAGARILYRPARFGAGKNQAAHSGWDCL